MVKIADDKGKPELDTDIEAEIKAHKRDKNKLSRKISRLSRKSKKPVASDIVDKVDESIKNNNGK